MNSRHMKLLSLVALLVLALSVSGFAQLPCGVANQIVCQPWDGGSNLFASQNDTNGFGNFATTYTQFNLPRNQSDWSLESFHWVGGYFNPAVQGAITGWTLTFYNDNAGAPGGAIASGFFPGNGNETFIGNVNGFPMYVYWLYFQDFDVLSGTYWASVVPDLGFPPQWGWATATGGNGYQCFFGACGSTGVGFAFAVDGTPTPEPSSMILLGSGILGLAGVIRRKLS